jgi:hypothetical protein
MAAPVDESREVGMLLGPGELMTERTAASSERGGG